MSNNEIVSKLWNLCNVLRDDGITYHQYLTELTYILFLKMLDETSTEKTIKDSLVDLDFLQNKQNKSNEDSTALLEKEFLAEYTWQNLVKLEGIELKQEYNKLLRLLGTHCKGHISAIYHDARSNIEEPKNLKKIINSIENLDWFSGEKEQLGDLYEGLLEKNANEKKSGAGQYFTPRVLIDVMVELAKPQLGEYCNDPACGTFGFMIAISQYLRKNNNFYALSNEQAIFQNEKALTGCELVSDTHRLALMNAILHDIKSDITCADTLSPSGQAFKDYDLVLTNPPFGTKQGGERTTRDDLTFPTSNKQLNFLQHIYRSLKADGKARACVVLPDNVLFDIVGDAGHIKADLMDKCNLHTVLRLPTGIFYAQGVKTNVLFFTRGKKDKDNTKEVYFYDMRTNMPSFGKTTPLKKEHFEDFIKAYTAEDRDAVNDERFSKYTRQEILDKGNSLDLGLIQSDDVINYEDLMNPIESGEEVIEQLEQALDLMKGVVKELKSLNGGK